MKSGLEAVFLDRDGVLNKNIDGDYVRRWNQFKFLPGALSALKRLSDAGLKIVFISNQAGLHLGLIKRKDFLEINRRLKETFKKNRIKVAGLLYCPHTKEENCSCRKPRPGFLFKARDRFGIDLKKSVLIGDAVPDMAAGSAGGLLENWAVLCGRTSLSAFKKAPVRPDRIFKNLSEAVKYLLRESLPAERKKK